MQIKTMIEMAKTFREIRKIFLRNGTLKMSSARGMQGGVS